MAYAHVLTARVHRSRFLRVAGAAKVFWAEYWRRKAEQDTVLVLRSLDDRTLKDIGIDRSEIESVVYAGAQTAAKERRVRLCAEPHGPHHRSGAPRVAQTTDAPGCA